MEQIYYVISGQMKVTVDDETATVGPGSVVFVPPHVIHDFSNAGDEVLIMGVISSFLDPEETRPYPMPER